MGILIRVDFPVLLGPRDQCGDLGVPEPDTFSDLQYQSGGERRTLRRESADELKRGHSGLSRRGCDRLEVPPQMGSSGLAPALTKGFHERIEMLREDSRSESLFAPEVVIERPFRDVDGRGYVSNADVRVAKTLKQRGGRTE